ncbi:hypothetical protein C8J56DRAFT_1075543 [Mycena floridula]|nr:hypothetical protein C8J56DRAFT_1075543 [Mycena floridula]
MSNGINALWAFFWKGKKKNQSQFHTYCKACVKNHQDWNPVDLSGAIDVASELLMTQKAFEDACEAVGPIRARITLEAEEYCDMIADKKNRLWVGLEMVVGDMEPICYGTNINQKDSTRADLVLLTLVGLYLHFLAHPEPQVAKDMSERLEKRFKDCDQPLYLLCLMLNPFEGLSCFGPKANLDHFKCTKLLLHMYRRMMTHPHNKDTPETRKEKERLLTNAFLEYLASSGTFSGMKENLDDFKETMAENPLRFWKVYLQSSDVGELAWFATLLLKIVVNQAGCERVFSHLKIQQTDHRSGIKLVKLEKMTKVGADIKMEHHKDGITKRRSARQNHASVEKLLRVPRYADLLEDIDDEDETERGRLLVTSKAGWRTDMARWIGEMRAQDSSDSDDDDSDNDQSVNTARIPTATSTRKWPKYTLATLFGGLPKPVRPAAAERGVPTAFDEEAALMEALADLEEDEIPDDGAMEGSGDDYT